MRLFTKKSCYHQGFFAVNGERFFMFLFLIPFTIRQQCIIYPHIFSTEPQCCTHFPLNKETAPTRVGGCVEPAESEQFVGGSCGVGGLLFVTCYFCGDFGDWGVVEATVEALSPYSNGIYWHITGRM